MAPRAPCVEEDRESIPAVSDVDILVIGGGITGCAVARDAAARGLSVVLIERRDLAAGTSGRSTKLLHGGLRYLEHGHLRLVREALHEREITARLAPALARPLGFILPTRRGVFPGRLAARAGVALYDLLAGRQPLPRGSWVSAGDIARSVPALSPGWTGGVAFSDRQTDDARLTVAIARDARRRGAEIRLGEAVTAFTTSGRGLSAACAGEDGRPSKITAAAVINAAGPWADGIRRLFVGAPAVLGLSRGAHLVLRGIPLATALLLPGSRRGHRLFAIPWRGATLFGTTDVADSGDPGRELAEIEDLRLLFHEALRLFPGAGLTRANVLSSFTGSRPLLAKGGDTLTASREHRVIVDGSLVTVAGGKLTTWRTMALQAVDAATRLLGRGGASPAALLHEPLPGGDDEHPGLETVLSEEMPRHAEDVVFRRLPIGHDPVETRRVLPSIVDAMAARSGWSLETRRDETARVLERLSAAAARIDDALAGA